MVVIVTVDFTMTVGPNFEQEEKRLKEDRINGQRRASEHRVLEAKLLARDVTIECNGRKDKLHKWNACFSDDNYIRNAFLLTNDTTQTVKNLDALLLLSELVLFPF